MSKENNLTNCKQRFKAIEGFLRRVAFNLGNSPSQTEVKIISCIPIDVTDLQQKIFELQRELEEAKNCSQKRPPVHTAICTTCPTCSTRCKDNLKVELTCNEGYNLESQSVFSLQEPDLSSKRLIERSSSISMVCPTESQYNCPYHTEQISKTSNTEKCKPKNFFSKKKKLSYKKRCKSQLVYCAQTNINSPFHNSNSLSDDFTSKNYDRYADKSAPLSRSYLTNMIQKQYTPQPILKGCTNLSEISSPVCKDNIPTCSQNSPYESDSCSCCHGQFQNIDDHLNTQNRFPEYATYENIEQFNRNTYYDSNFYDLVPVKENPVKIRNDIVIHKTKEPKRPIIKCWPEKVRHKHKTQPTVVNYCTVSPMRDCRIKRFPAKSQSRTDFVRNKMAAKRVTISPPPTKSPHPQRDENPPDLCCVDLGPVYAKQVINQKKSIIMNSNVIANKKRNVAITCLTTKNNNADCQTAIASAETPPEDKTETTLKQIKSILQSVLTEVKTSTKLGKNLPLSKKDAIVQNGPSQGNMFGGSQLLQSYTYSPYNMNPYIASCSQPMSSNYTYPELQGRCLQQYPLLIQPQKHMCTNCFRNTQVTKSVNTRRATSAATNTVHTQEHSKETEQLIKEIYKSMALNVEIPSSKDNTIGAYTKIKTNAKDSTNKFLKIESDKESNIADAISEIFRNTKPLESTITGNTVTTLPSKLTSNEASVESKRGNMHHHMPERMRNYSQNNSTVESTEKEIETEELSRNLESGEQSDNTVVNRDTESSGSETETDDVVVDGKESVNMMDTKKEKNGLFKKMLKIFKPRQRCRRKDAAKEDQKESESDSDDYQTVYSHKVDTPKPKNVINTKSRAHSKIFYSKQPQQRRAGTRSPEKNTRTSPYMEQEYRRHWDEKLMFHNDAKRYSTEVSRNTRDSPRMRDTARRPVYYQSYEARNVLVDPIRQVPLRMPGNASLPQHLANSNYPKNIYDGNRPSYGNKPEYSKNMPNYSGNRSNYQGNPNYTGNNNTSPASNSHIKPHFVTSKSNGLRKNMMTAKGLKWLKKHKLQCGQQWKELILEG